jgi:hypothetical protein
MDSLSTLEREIVAQARFQGKDELEALNAVRKISKKLDRKLTK